MQSVQSTLARVCRVLSPLAVSIVSISVIKHTKCFIILSYILVNPVARVCSCSEDDRGFVAEVASFSRRGCALSGRLSLSLSLYVYVYIIK